MLAPGSCLSYRVAPGGALLFAQLSARRVDGSWTVCPLVDHDTLDPALLPLSPNHDQTARLDSHIRIIPRLVLDARRSSRVVWSEETCTDWTPVLVVNEYWFRAGYMFYRAGMSGVYRASQLFDETSAAAGGLAQFLSRAAFPISERDALLFGPAPADPVCSLLASSNGPLDSLFAVFKFRAALADQFSSALRKNAGKAGSLSFDMRCSPQAAGSLFSWPEVRAVTELTVSGGKESNRVSYIVTQSTIFTPAVLKNLVVLKLSDPLLLQGFLGKTF
jgi:hypothetical protein